jgi:alkaline phosphatase
MRRTLLALAAAALATTAASAQTIYPLDRATILTGAKFDLKVEFPGVVKAADARLTVNGVDAEQAFGRKPEFVEKEKDAAGSALILRNVTIPVAGNVKVEASAAGATASANWTVFSTPGIPRARNVIFFLGDGMTVSMRTAARIMSKGNVEGKSKGRLAMDDMPAMAFIGTSSTDAITADSANTMSAYMTGHKSAVNALGVYADRTPDAFDDPKVETIAELVRRNTNKSIGVVSNAELEDATPAATVAHTRRRDNKAEIVGMFYDVKPEVMLGGGSAYFLPQKTAGSKRKDDIDYIARFKDAGYTLVTSKTELAAAGKDGRMLGLFHPSNMDGTLDQKFLKKGTVPQFPDQPDLPEMTKAALDTLSKNENGFFLMVEGALIDKFEHPLDWDRAVVETITFDKSIAIAMEFAKTHPDTLIIVTADHTHGVSIIGTVDDSKPGTGRDKVGTYQNAGFPNYEDKDGDGYPDSVNVSRRLAIFANNFPDYYETFAPHMDNPFVPAVQNEKKEYVANEKYKDVPGAVLRVGNLPRDADTGVHSVDDVVLQAWGPGSENLKGYMENSDVFRVIAETLALGAPQRAARNQ